MGFDKVAFTGFAVILCVTVCSASFSYNENDSDGPDHWTEGTECGSDKRQSPIDIETAKVLGHQDFTATYSCDTPVVKGTLTNNGHAPSIAMTEGTCLLDVADVPEFGSGTFRLVSFHFHFSGKNYKGSEHQMNGRPYASEVHFVHLNTKYPTVSEALDHSDGLAVVAVFLRRSARRASLVSKMLNRINDIKTVNSAVDVEVRVEAILSPRVNRMYTYSGSLTTPPCSEAVQWFIVHNKLRISHTQLRKLRQLHTGESMDSPLIADDGNDRPLQPLSGRTVYSNF